MKSNVKPVKIHVFKESIGKNPPVSNPVFPFVSRRPFLPMSFFPRVLHGEILGSGGEDIASFFEGSLTGQHRYILDNPM